MNPRELNRLHFDGSARSLKDLGSRFGVFWTDLLIRRYDGAKNRSLSEWLVERGWIDELGRPLQEVQPRLRAALVDGGGDELPVPWLGPGVQCFYTLYGESAALLSTDLVHLELDGAGEVVEHERSDYPFGVEERAVWSSGVTVVARVSFGALDTVEVEYEVCLLDSPPTSVIPTLRGATVAERRFQRLETAENQIVALVNPAVIVTHNNGLTQTNHATVTLPLADLRVGWRLTTSLPGAVATPAAGSVPVLTFEGPLEYAWRGAPLMLEAGQRVCFTVGVEGLRSPAERDAAAGTPHRPGSTFESAERRWGTYFDTAPPLPPESAGHEQLYYHALTTLRLNQCLGDGPFLGTRRALFGTRGWEPLIYYWDTCFNAVALAQADPVAAQEALEVVLANPNPFGAPAECLGFQSRTGAGQAPVEAWAAWRVYQCSGDRSFLERVHAPIVDYNRYWFEYRDIDQDGLCEWRNGGQVADNSPRWDRDGRQRFNQELGDVESPDLSGFLYSQMTHLALIAEELGRPEESRAWLGRCRDLREQVLAKLYAPELLSFVDIHTLSHQPQHAPVPHLFIPLWAGLDPGIDVARDMLARWLLAPEHFFGDPPFPSVAYSHPAYDPLGYWRGRVWPHISYWMTETLWRYGFRAEADLAADRFIALVERWRLFPENFTGDGVPAGDIEITWSAAATVLFLLRRYRIEEGTKEEGT